MNPSQPPPQEGGPVRQRSRLARLLFVGAGLLAAFCAGMYVAAAKIFPADFARSAYRTLVFHLKYTGFQAWANPDRTNAKVGRSSVGCSPLSVHSRNKLKRKFGLKMLRCPAAHVPRADAAAARIEFVAGNQLADPVLVKGSVGTFLDHCPAPWGCLAVEYSRTGTVSRAWPFRPEEIAAANISPVSDHPYEHPLGWSFPRGMETYHISPYPGGDLLVVFHSASSSPFGIGVARVAPDGRPRWYRKDYSHHWPHVIAGDLALVPSGRLHQRRPSYKIGVGDHQRIWTLACPDLPILEDQVNVVDGHGTLLEEIPILDAIAASRHASRLLASVDVCNPTHLNFVHVLGADAGGAPGIAPDDLVVSLRNLNAFAILDKNDRHLKRFVRGSFQRQHGVRHLRRAQFVMFDNLGTDGHNGPSRLLIVDLATGEETTVFPNNDTPHHMRGFFTSERGQFDISADRRRVVLTDLLGGRALEIRLADGAVLNVFHQIHDLSDLAGFPDELTKNAWTFRFQGIHYANGSVPLDVGQGRLHYGEAVP